MLFEWIVDYAAMERYGDMSHRSLTIAAEDVEKAWTEAVRAIRKVEPGAHMRIESVLLPDREEHRHRLWLMVEYLENEKCLS